MKQFILYDGRAKSGDTDDAAVICCASSAKECRQDADLKRDYDGIWYEYDVVTVQGEKVPQLLNEKRRDDL